MTTLLDLYSLIEKIQNKIEGNCHVSVSVPREKTLKIMLEWKVNDKFLFFARCFDLEEIQEFELTDSFIELANHAYNKKKREIQ